MSNYNCLTMMILRKCRANYEELTSLINKRIGQDAYMCIVARYRTSIYILVFERCWIDLEESIN